MWNRERAVGECRAENDLCDRSGVLSTFTVNGFAVKPGACTPRTFAVYGHDVFVIRNGTW